MSSFREFVEIHGLRFHCETSGRPGEPWLVFSNSLMTNLTMWDAQERAFRESYRILRYDQRGHGETQAPDASCTIDELADDLEALCEAFQIARAVMIGVSMGGVTALRMAQRHPSRVAGLVACDCQWFSPATSTAVWDDRIRTANDGGMSGLVEPTISRWFRPAFVERRGPGLDDVRRMIETTPVAGFVSCARALQSFDVRVDFARIAAPTCFVVGDGDGVLPTVMRDMHRGLPGSSFVQIAEAGHLPNIEQPATVNHAIQAFLIQIGWHPHL
ncbi:MAG: alpha/beta fold hydrolase [Vicinamibacterales bacterium]